MFVIKFNYICKVNVTQNLKQTDMKTHLQKTRTQNGKVVKYSIPECNKRGSVNSYLMIVELNWFKQLSETDRKNCCVNCLAALK